MADWRYRARVVAMLDIQLTLMGLIWLMMLLVGMFVLHEEIKIEVKANVANQKEMEEAMTFGVFLVLASITLALVFGLLQLYAAFKLLRATEIGKDPNEACNKAQYYKTMSMIVVVFTVFLEAVHRQVGGVLLTIVVRGTFIFIVHRFMKVLEEAKLRLPVVKFEVSQSDLEDPK